MALDLDHSDTLLTRVAVAAALTAAGFPVKAATLATKATRGGGPPYRLFGVRPLYRWGDSVAWAESRLTALHRPHRADQAGSKLRKVFSRNSPATKRSGNIATSSNRNKNSICARNAQAWNRHHFRHGGSNPYEHDKHHQAIGGRAGLPI